MAASKVSFERDPVHGKRAGIGDSFRRGLPETHSRGRLSKRFRITQTAGNPTDCRFLGGLSPGRLFHQAEASERNSLDCKALKTEQCLGAAPSDLDAALLGNGHDEAVRAHEYRGPEVPKSENAPRSASAMPTSR